MSSILEAEKALTNAKNHLRTETIKDLKNRIGQLLKNGSDKELAIACRKMAGMLMPPNAGGRKPKAVSPSPV